MSRLKSEVPLGAIYVDASGAGGSQEATPSDIKEIRRQSKIEHHFQKIIDWIPDNIYKRIVGQVPILCVDLIIRRNSDANILLVKRAVEPLRGEWWIPGGAVKRGEHELEDACRRIAMSEVGMEVWNLNPIGYYNEYFYDTPHGQKHTLSIVFDAETDNIRTPKIDESHTEWSWSTTLPELFKKNCNLSHKMFR
jgi:colanic acid biosynthesis protein WcaH